MKRIIKLEASWCTPCKIVSKFLDAQNVQYERIDIDENPDQAAKYDVMSIPVTLLLDGEDEIARVIGYNPNELVRLIELSK